MSPTPRKTRASKGITAEAPPSSAPTPPAPTPPAPTPSRAERCAALIERLSAGLVERKETTTLALLATLAGESVFLLGPPGTAKSLISRRLACALKRDDGGPTAEFHYLMGRFSTPEELFGPISVRGLKEDRYERKTEGYLPSAHVAFLDELWKASPSIQNALLTALNERLYRNGAQEVEMPLRALVAASNELPEAGKGLEALWDRFLVRLWVGGVGDPRGWVSMICDATDLSSDPLGADPSLKALKVTLSELDAWRREAREVEVGPAARAALLQIRVTVDTLAQEERAQGRALYVSDRRWRKVVGLLKTSAYLSGRASVSAADLAIAPWCLWDHPAQLEPLKEVIHRQICDVAFGVDLGWPALFHTARRLYNTVRASRDPLPTKGYGNSKPQIGPNFFAELALTQRHAQDHLELLRARSAELLGRSLFTPAEALTAIQTGERVATGALEFLIQELDDLSQSARNPRAWLRPEDPFQPPTLPSQEVNTEQTLYWRGTRLDEPLAHGEHEATLELVYCPPGESLMGNNLDAHGVGILEGPIHSVRITRGLWVGATPVTHAQYLAVMGYAPTEGKKLNVPVTRVSWFDAVEFCNALSEQRGLTPAYDISYPHSYSRPHAELNLDADGYRLLTEAEWERCARAGGDLEFSGGEEPTEPIRHDSYNPLTKKTYLGTPPRLVKQRRPNLWGLYDMSGNVGEWCNDQCDLEDDGYSVREEPRVDPIKYVPHNTERIVRGGLSFGVAKVGSVTARDLLDGEEKMRAIGFRVARLARP